MKISWVLLAEGMTIDGRGAVTAVGIGQQIFVAPSLPTTTKRAIVIHIVEESGLMKPNSSFNFAIRVTDPKGNVVVAQTASVAVGHIPWPTLPITTVLPLELALNLSEYGAYRFDVQVQPPDGAEPSDGSVEMHVARPEDQIPPPAH